MIAFSDSATFSNLANLTNSGTLKFTSASGVLTTAGNVSFSPASLFSLQVTPGAASKIVAGGSATLAGAVSATFAPGSYSLGSSYVILSASSHTGTFSSLETSDLNRTLRASLDYGSADNVSIDITSALITTAGLNRNQTNVANTLNSYFSGSGYLPPGFLTVFQQTGATLANSLTQLSGETATGAQKAALDIANSFINTMMNPYVGNRGAGGSFGPMSYAPAPTLAYGSDTYNTDNVLAYAKKDAKPSSASPLAAFGSPPPPPRWSMWGSAYGGQATVSGDAAVGSSTTTRVSGFAAGIDYRIQPDTIVGFSLAGGSGKWSLANGLGGGQSNVFQLGGFASQRFGAAYLSAGLAFGANWMSTNRVVTVNAPEGYNADFFGATLSSRLEGGYRVEAQDFGLTPYGAVQFTTFSTPAYSEQLAGGPGTFGLSYAGRTFATTRTELGSWADRTFVLATGNPLVLRVRLAWAHDVNNDDTAVAAFQTLPGTTFVVGGAVPNPNSALVSIAAEYFFNSEWRFVGRFDGEFSPNRTSYAGTGTLRRVW